MTVTEIEQVVRSLLVEEFKVDPEGISPEAKFKQIGLDSLDMVSFAMALEDRLGIELPEPDVAGIERLDQALDLLERKVAARS